MRTTISTDEKVRVSEVSVETVFCDDIRTENNGKDLILGIYQGDMVVPNYPALISQLYIRTTVTLPADRAVVGTILYELPEGRVVESSIPHLGDETPPTRSHPMHPDEVPVRRAIQTRRFGPLQFNGPGKIKVRLKLGSEIYAAGLLRIFDVTELYEGTHQAVDQNAVDVVLKYAATYLPKVEKKNSGEAALDVLRILKSLAGDKLQIDFQDSEQPIWVMADPNSIWILKTQEWHDTSRLSVSLDGQQLAYQVVEDGIVGILLRFEQPIIRALQRIQVTCSTKQTKR